MVQIRRTTARAADLVRGLRTLRRAASTVDAAVARVGDDARHRDRRFLATLDDLVWSVPASPYRLLLEHAGIDPADVRALVDSVGVDATLERLRDEGVYVAYDEWLGRRPLVRGSRTFELGPESFFNPRVAPDLIGSTGGTRSGGAAVAVSFANLRHGALLEQVRARVWDQRPGPVAVWLPVLPSGAGLNTVLR